jgi:hypothetical protein
VLFSQPVPQGIDDRQAIGRREVIEGRFASEVAD